MCGGLPLHVLWRISSLVSVWLAAVWNETVTAAGVSDTRKQEKGAHGHLKHWGQSCGDFTKKVWGQEDCLWHSAWAKEEGQKPNSCIEVATTERPGLKCDFYIKWDFRAIIVMILGETQYLPGWLWVLSREEAEGRGLGRTGCRAARTMG